MVSYYPYEVKEHQFIQIFKWQIESWHSKKNIIYSNKQKNTLFRPKELSSVEFEATIEVYCKKPDYIWKIF